MLTNYHIWNVMALISNLGSVKSLQESEIPVTSLYIISIYMQSCYDITCLGLPRFCEKQ